MTLLVSCSFLHSYAYWFRFKIKFNLTLYDVGFLVNLLVIINIQSDGVYGKKTSSYDFRL